MRRRVISQACARRRGSAAIMALVAFAVTALILTAAIRMVVIEHRTLRAERYRDQAGWLADAGIELAALRLALDSEYLGETWKPSAEALDLPDGGEVTIQIEPLAGGAGLKQITAKAVYPADHAPQARAQRTIHWNDATRGE